jgi:hypothetical protein
MPVKNPLGDKQNAFNRNNVSHEDVNPHLVDGLRQREGTPIVARPLPIMQIIPDRVQPRRVLPRDLLMSWNGEPEQIMDLLMLWHQQLQRDDDAVPDLRGIMLGETEMDLSEDHPAHKLIRLALLAGDIHQHGLDNPITVYRKGDGEFMVIAGERRLLAHHLLTMLVDDSKYKKIPATIEEERNVWRQAAENNARDDLNAISKARQLALLMIELYKDDEQFLSYDEAVTDCDRAYYAQVANGYKYSHKKDGDGSKVLTGMGLTSPRMISAYRALLSIPDALWMRADDENWAEGAIRAYNKALDKLFNEGYKSLAEAALDEEWSIQALENTVEEYVKDEESLPIGKLDTPQTADRTPTPTHTPDTRTEHIPSDDTRQRPPAPQYTNRNFATGDRVYHTRHGLARIDRVEDHAHVAIRTEDTNSLLRNIHESTIEPAAEDAQDAGSATPQDPLTHPPAAYHCPYNIGDWLALESKPARPGKVVHIKDEQNPPIVTVQMADNGQQVSALLGAWQRSAPAIPKPQPQPTPAAAINDLPHDLGTELADALSVIETMIDIHQRWMPDEDYSDVRDALQLLRTGTLEEIHKRTPEELDGSIDLLSAMLGHMHDAFQHRLGDAFHALNDRRDS